MPDTIESPRPCVVVNALVFHQAMDGARFFLENVLAHLSDAWPAARIIVLGPDRIALPFDRRLEVVRVRSSGPGVARVVTDLGLLARLVKRLGADVLISPNESVPTRVGCAVVVVAQNLLYHCASVGALPSGPLHARLRSRLQFAFYRRQMPRAYRRADAVAVVSRHAAETLIELAGLPRSRVTVVPCGADRLPVEPRRQSAAPRRLLAVGAVAHYKRLEVAVAALARLRESGDYELLLVGEEWPGYGDVVDLAADRAGVGAHVKRLGGVADPELANLFATSHALVALSTCESFGIPVAEAMRAGLPVVVADEPWSAELARDAGVRVDATRPASVADSIRSLESADEWRRRAENGRRVAERYTWEGTAAGLVAAAQEAIRRRGSLRDR